MTSGRENALALAVAEERLAVLALVRIVCHSLLSTGHWLPVTFEQTVALRYLRGASGRDARRGFLRFVVVAAIGGVAVGTGALLLAMMIVRGFSREIEAKIVGFGQHVQVESILGEPLAGADSLARDLGALPGVARVEPAVIDFTLLRGKREAGKPGVDGVLLWGTTEAGQPFLAANVASLGAGAGRFSFAPDARGRPGLVLGRDLAERLGLSVGDAVTAFSTRGLGAGEVSSRPRVKAFHVAGVFDTGLGDFDEQFAYTSIASVRSLFAYAPDQATRPRPSRSTTAAARPRRPSWPASAWGRRSWCAPSSASTAACSRGSRCSSRSCRS